MSAIENPKNLPIYSYSKIKSFYNCPYYFYLYYLDRPEDFCPVGHGASEFGTFLHKILEMYEKGQLGEYELLPYYEKYYPEAIQSTFVLDMGNNFKKDMSSIYYEGGKKYLESFEGYGDLKILKAEYKFYQSIEDKFIFNGIVDLVTEDKDGNLVVIDHKSKGKFKNKSELHDYSRQLYLYAMAIHKKYGRYPKRLKFNMFRINEWVEFDFDSKDYREAIDWAIKSVEEIENAFDFKALPGTFFCKNFCAAREICDKNR